MNFASTRFAGAPTLNQSFPRAVVFDLDGLMFNTEELYQEVGSEILRRRGIIATSYVRGPIEPMDPTTWAELDALIEKAYG